jgi:hypothetical protein
MPCNTCIPCACFNPGFLLYLLFDLEDGAGMFLRNVQCFLLGPCEGYITKVCSGYQFSSGPRVIRLALACDRETLNVLQCSTVVSVVRPVARRRLVETENPSACATVDCKVCEIAIALYASVNKSGCNQSMIIKSNHPN